MTDRELLELAAKAAGKKPSDSDGIIYAGFGSREWNPRKDDGDALRLGAVLGMNLYINKSYCIAEIISDGDGPNIHAKEYVIGGDTLAAARLAIVRAAAEIGAQQCQTSK